ncbi:MAG: hypothetical protein ACXVRS_16245 [Gaiellaceae bacterium]
MGLRAEHLSLIDNAEVITRSEELTEDDPIVALIGSSRAEHVKLSGPTLALTAVQEAAL